MDNLNSSAGCQTEEVQFHLSFYLATQPSYLQFPCPLDQLEYSTSCRERGNLSCGFMEMLVHLASSVSVLEN